MAGRATKLAESRIGRRVGAALVAVALSAALVSCLPSYSGAAGAPKVAVWGDSIMNNLLFELPPALRAGHYRESLASHPGRTTDQLRTEFGLDYAATNPDDVVISTGTNDAYEVAGPWNGAYELALQQQVLDDFPTAKCIVWINVNEALPNVFTTGVNPNQHAADFNAGLRYWQARYPKLKIVDWNAILDFLGRGILADGIHPGPFAQHMLAGVVRDTLNANGCR